MVSVIARVLCLPNTPPQAEIFKLKMDHFEEIFDYLSLHDLVVLSQTGKRMRRIVGYYVKTNYAASEFHHLRDGIKQDYDGNIKVDELSSFLKSLVFDYSNMLTEYRPWIGFEYLSKRKVIWIRKLMQPLLERYIPHVKVEQFKSLTEIYLSFVDLTDTRISRMKEILGQLETVKLFSPNCSNKKLEFYDAFLRFCTNIKRLFISGPNRIGYNWLLQKYPTLEHLELICCGDRPTVELKTFFEQNPNVRTFTMDTKMILTNSHILKNTNARWDVLALSFHFPPEYGSFRDQINELYERGLFKEFHIYFYRFAHYNEELATMKGLTKLHIYDMDNGYDFSHLVGLKQLCIHSAEEITNIMTLAEKLINLESIQFLYASIRDILPFIRYSSKLTKIVVFRLKKCDKTILNVAELNEQRSKLNNARKVTIYVEESVYLAAKWSINQTDGSLVRIKRGSSCVALNNRFETYKLNSVGKF